MERGRRLALRRTWPAAIAVLVGAVAWVWAARALWASAVPDDVHLPHISASRYFSASFLERSDTYGRFLAIEGLVLILTMLVVLALYARYGHRLMRESAAGRVGTGMLLGMLGFGVLWLVYVPFGLVALWWERRYGVSHQGYVQWLFDSFFSLGGQFLFISVALLVAMGVAGVLRNWWWTVAAPAWVAIALVFTFVSPYLIPSTSPLQDPALKADMRALEQREGVDGVRARVQEVSRYTTAPNAESAGFGPTRTVVLWDTLLDGRFSRPQVRMVMAHEVAHLAHDDPLRSVGWLALFLIPASALVAFVTRRRGGMARPEAVPLALLVLVALQLLATPLFNEVSRRQEAAADWTALTTTRQPAVQRSVMRRLATTSLDDPDPPGWASFLYGTHPTIMQRIAMTYAWEDRSGDAAPTDARRPPKPGGPR